MHWCFCCYRYAQRLPWLLPWLAHHHHPARTAAARLTGIAAAGLVDPAAALQLLQGTLLAPWDKEGAAQAGGTVSGSASSASSATLEAREGYLLAAGGRRGTEAGRKPYQAGSRCDLQHPPPSIFF
jgi:hypothetical protein